MELEADLWLAGDSHSLISHMRNSLRSVRSKQLRISRVPSLVHVYFQTHSVAEL